MRFFHRAKRTSMERYWWTTPSGLVLGLFALVTIIYALNRRRQRFRQPFDVTKDHGA